MMSLGRLCKSKLIHSLQAAVSEAIMKLIPGLSCDIPSLLTRAKTIEQDLMKVKTGQNNSAINLYR
jgi:uncharacterized protein